MASNLLRFPQQSEATLFSVQHTIEELNAVSTAALCGLTALLFLLTLIALIRCARLKRRVDELSASVDSLQTENAARYTRQILNRPIAGDSD
jgi:hypothetical protein